MTQVVSEIVFVMRTRTIRHAQTVVEIFDRITGKARGNDRAVASLAILIALQAGASVNI
jgi:hypothetical protein